MNLSTDNIFGPLFHQITSTIPRIPIALMTLLIGYIAVRIVQLIIFYALKAVRLNHALRGIIMSTCTVLLWVGVLALLFQSLGMSQVAVAISGSIALIAIGIGSGMTKLVSDVVAGAFLAKDRHFSIGGKIKIGDISGRVHSMDGRKVRIVDEKGNLYTVPNGQFDTMAWMIEPDKDKEKEKK